MLHIAIRHITNVGLKLQEQLQYDITCMQYALKESHFETDCDEYRVLNQNRINHQIYYSVQTVSFPAYVHLQDTHLIYAIWELTGKRYMQNC